MDYVLLSVELLFLKVMMINNALNIYLKFWTIIMIIKNKGVSFKTLFFYKVIKKQKIWWNKTTISDYSVNLKSKFQIILWAIY